MSRRLIPTLLLVAVLATPAAAQSRSASTTATTTVIANLTLTATQAMVLGSPSGNFASAGVVTSSDPGALAAHWAGTSDPGNSIQVLFNALPTALTAPSGSSVPFSCGSN